MKLKIYYLDEANYQLAHEFEPALDDSEGPGGVTDDELCRQVAKSICTGGFHYKEDGEPEHFVPAHRILIVKEVPDEVA